MVIGVFLWIFGGSMAAGLLALNTIHHPQFLTIMVCYLVAFFLLSMVLGYIVGKGKYK
jgi:hypothetical protein